MTARKLKLLFVSRYADNRRVATMLDYWDRIDGVELMVVSWSVKENFRAQMENMREGRRYSVFHCDKQHNNMFDREKLHYAIEAFRPDAIVFTTEPYEPGIHEDIKTGKKYGIPVFLGCWQNTLKPGASPETIRDVGQHITGLFASSGTIRDFYVGHGIPEEKICVLPVGCTDDRYYTSRFRSRIQRMSEIKNRPMQQCKDMIRTLRDVISARDRFGLNSSWDIVLFPGRIIWDYKGFAFQVPAMKRLIEEYPTVHWVIAGAAPATESGTLDRIKEGMGALWATNCHHIPWITDQEELATLYQACDVMSYPSQPLPGNIIEQYGFVFPEALFSDVPIIAPSAGAGPEFVRAFGNYANGIVVQHSSVDALYEGLKRVLFTEYHNFIGHFHTEDHGRQHISKGWIEFIKEQISWTR